MNPTIVTLISLSLIAFIAEDASSEKYPVSEKGIQSLDIAPALGRGYDSVTETLRSTCLYFDESIDLTATQAEMTYTFFDFAETLTANDETERSQLLEGTFGKDEINAELSIVQKTTSKLHIHSYVSASVMRFERELELSKEILVDKAREVLNNKDYVGFFKACGPAYINAIKRAQEVIGIFKYNAVNRELASEYAMELAFNATPKEHPNSVDGACTDLKHVIDKDGKCCEASMLVETGVTLYDETIEEVVVEVDSTESAPGHIRSRWNQKFCMTLMRGKSEADIMSWTCGGGGTGGIKDEWQQWIVDDVGTIRSNMYPEKCISIGRNAQQRNKPRLEFCGTNPPDYLKWTFDDKGRIKNVAHGLYIGVSSGCFIGLNDGAVLEAQRLHDASDKHICPKYTSQYWRPMGTKGTEGSSTTEVITKIKEYQEVICRPFDPPDPPRVAAQSAGTIKFSSISKTLTIKIRGYGIGLDQYGSSALVATNMQEYNDVMHFVYLASLKPFEDNTESFDNYQIGLVYGLWVTPWVDNLDFQRIVGVQDTDGTLTLELPDPAAAITEATDGVCPTDLVIDSDNLCCAPSALYDLGTKTYGLIDAALNQGGAVLDPESDPSSPTASYAVDGDSNTVAQSASATDPYWQLVLSTDHELKRIVMSPKIETDFSVIIHRDGVEIYTSQMSDVNNDGTNSVIEIPTNRFVVGNTVKIVHLGANKILSLAEVQIYGYPLESDDNKPTRIYIEKNKENAKMCITLPRGNPKGTDLMLWLCGSKQVKPSWQRWYYGADNMIRSGVDPNKCVYLKEDAKERNTFQLTDCDITATNQQWLVDEERRIYNKMHDHLHIGMSSGCTSLYVPSKADVLEAQIKYQNPDDCNNGDYTEQLWNFENRRQTQCRPTAQAAFTEVKVKMESNALFISRLDMAIRQRQAQLANLQYCISSTKYIPATNDFYILQAMANGRYIPGDDTQFTLAQLKKAIDPFGDYKLFKHLGYELDEYLAMYVTPCYAALHGLNDMNGLHSSITDEDFFMSNTWFDLVECNPNPSQLSSIGYPLCIENDMRWSRKDGGGCVSNLMTGTSAADYDDTDNTDFCATNMEPDPAECKYKKADLEKTRQSLVNCWNSPNLPSESISYLMEHYCNAGLSSRRVSQTRETELTNHFTTHCPASTSTYRRKLNLRRSKKY